MAVCLVLLNFVYKQAVRQGLMAVLALALLVNVASEGAANFQARVTMKKTDTPAELMEQKMAQYEADRKSDDKETKYRAEMNKPQDFFREMYRADLGQCLDYLEQKDQSFYRVEKDYISGTVAMDASAQGCLDGNLVFLFRGNDISHHPMDPMDPVPDFHDAADAVAVSIIPFSQVF